MIDDLTDRELQVVVRHELSHYRHAEARWAPLQALAGLSPVLVIIYGWPLAHLIGEVATVVAYFLSLGLHVLAFKSKRFFEARADHESVLNIDDAHAAQRALLKFGTLKERTEEGLTGEAADQAINAFAQRVNEPEKFSDRAFNMIWGLHPPLKDRLARYDEYVAS